MSDPSDPALQPQNQRTSTPGHVPATHWISIGYDEDAANIMDAFQKRIKEFCEGNNPEHHNRLCPWMNVSGVDDDLLAVFFGDRTVPYHELLLPHWRVFAQFFRERTLTEFKILHIDLTDPVVDLIQPAMQAQQLTKLELSLNNMGVRGLHFLAEYLTGNTSLKSLILRRNQIASEDAASAFSLAIDNHPCLEFLSLPDCSIGENDTILSSIIRGCNKLRNLVLSGNNVGRQGGAIIADFLSNDICSTEMVLRHNNLSDENASALATALQQNSKLAFLGLARNNLSTHGQKELMKAVFDTTNVNAIIDSCNHSCELELNSSSRMVLRNNIETAPLEHEAQCINRRDCTKEGKIKSKILLFFMRFESRCIQHFNELPLELVPDGLAFIQEEIDPNANSDGLFFHHRSCQYLQEEEVNIRKHEFEKDALNTIFGVLQGLLNLPVLLQMKTAKVGKRKRE